MTCRTVRCRADTGKVMRFTGTTILKVENGMITEEVGLDDGVTTLRQLGLITQGLTPAITVKGHGHPPRPLTRKATRSPLARARGPPRGHHRTRSAGDLVLQLHLTPSCSPRLRRRNRQSLATYAI